MLGKLIITFFLLSVTMSLLGFSEASGLSTLVLLVLLLIGAIRLVYSLFSPKRRNERLYRA